jgi:hypothetical protein
MSKRFNIKEWQDKHLIKEAYDTELELRLKHIHNNNAVIPPKVLVALKNKGKLLRIKAKINKSPEDIDAGNPLLYNWDDEITAGFEQLFDSLGIAEFNIDSDDDVFTIFAVVPDTDPKTVKYLKTLGFKKT